MFGYHLVQKAQKLSAQSAARVDFDTLQQQWQQASADHAWAMRKLRRHTYGTFILNCIGVLSVVTAGVIVIAFKTTSAYAALNMDAAHGLGIMLSTALSVLALTVAACLYHKYVAERLFAAGKAKLHAAQLGNVTVAIPEDAIDWDGDAEQLCKGRYDSH